MVISGCNELAAHYTDFLVACLADGMTHRRMNFRAVCG